MLWELVRQRKITHALQIEGFEASLCKERNFNIAEEQSDAHSQRVQVRLSIKAATQRPLGYPKEY